MRRLEMTTLKIDGMSCNHCVTAVEKALGAVEGITNVRVNLERGEAAFDTADALDPDAAEAAIEKAGYKIG
jgi:copper chaperone